jgi:hypothetical protein
LNTVIELVLGLALVAASRQRISSYLAIPFYRAQVSSLPSPFVSTAWEPGAHTLHSMAQPSPLVSAGT